MILSTLNTILFEVVDDSIAIITINRPEKLNSFTPEVLEELNKALDFIEKNNEIKVAVLTGAGPKSFVVGNDISQLVELDTIQAFDQMREGQNTFLRIHEFPKPVIAMVNGYALGGGFELALSCDLIFASARAKFGFPEINLNTMPGWGGTQLSVKKLGLNRAKEMVLTGQYYSSEECREFGFINRITLPENLLSETMDMARLLASKELLSLKFAKESLNRGEDLDLSTGFKYEAQLYSLNFSVPHAKDGFLQFLNNK